eukprot:TRINITY_DN29894_c0_g1_i2.p1 TRINITY_DN29894_c0_g1~~TRINITY_DN29894_c0_g1_i2.p1  ORF type:complete len:303 (-),score=24.28 TRINITY_DN29894_c0_g1_i2:8-868(-)
MTPYPELYCVICCMVPRDPMECASCSQLFCKKCIQKWMHGKNQCPNRCDGKNIRMASKVIVKLIRNLEIKCVHCGMVKKIESIDKHQAECKKPKCANDACETLESAITTPQHVFLKGEKKVTCSLQCKFVAQLQEVLTKDEQYIPILRKAHDLFSEYGKQNDLHINCQKQVHDLISEFEKHSSQAQSQKAYIPRNPGKNGFCDFTLDQNHSAQGITLSHGNKSCYLQEAGYCFRTVLGNAPMTSGIYYWEIHADPRTENELKIGVSSERSFNLNTVPFLFHFIGFL